MAHSLEARFPFLDHELMEFGARLPQHLKATPHGETHSEKSARSVLPDEVMERSKMGFGVPLAQWLRGDLRDLAWDALTDSTARSRGYFDPTVVAELLRSHDCGEDRSARIWTPPDVRTLAPNVPRSSPGRTAADAVTREP